MTRKDTIKIAGVENTVRVDSRILEERIQKAVADGCRHIEVTALGQHGIGGRLWRAHDEPVKVDVLGTSGQRLGSMGFANTTIQAFGPASDDVGWLNAGAKIIVHGNATNGAANAMAQGRVYIGGNIGARGMTMTKYNPRFEPPELWVFGKAGDSFAEFMAGGIAVICGAGAEEEKNVLGYRPCVGMVGGKIFFRGSQEAYSQPDARLVTDLPDDEWEWLKQNLKTFLDAIGRQYLFEQLAEKREDWQLLIARKPSEKASRFVRPMAKFKQEVWEHELGRGGLIGDLSSLDRSPIDVITTGALRRFVPSWENEKYLPPCQAACPTGIPVQKRWELIRKGHLEEAVNLALEYTPFPAAVCGHLCPNLCMQSCTRNLVKLDPVDVRVLGKASLQAKVPRRAPETGKKIAVVGGGPAGLSVAWQLWLSGHDVTIVESRKQLGGKITDSIPKSRIPAEVVEHEIARLARNLTRTQTGQALTRQGFAKLKNDHDFVVIAAGAQSPRKLPVPGMDRTISALEFLRQSKLDCANAGEKVVIIGAGNVGCDAATEAFRLGAKSVTLIDVQEPASFGVERQHAEAAGAVFLWPRVTKAVTDSGVELTSGDVLPADTVIVAVGELPDLSFLPEEIATERGFVLVDDTYATSDSQVYAIGDAVRPGLLTDAIGAGRIAARSIDDSIRGAHESYDKLPPIRRDRVKLQYFDPRAAGMSDPASCATRCASCGACRDCGLCEEICPEQAISRIQTAGGKFRYEVNAERCIGCGFCAGACPTGVWEIAENKPLA
ncbi:MAG TPA: FAD-dependent oxidoreductase [Smithellaceae bacterium]|jgi:NADPH-dependent glutamate synthase beta subunit-like oxidoreductase/glutamate synthase domain-containing protein 3/NAD-dependent dihydropyrimidine dehydrogenase PreA subunit|nr:MAG: Glutamate synthase (NADPH) small chain [Deltaproteobacteria bacterium ADurb.Bin002]HOE22343.1 FAD-dependent oxidoreductase [Smithellaceae bacterium]HOR62409.1 FAD-dependent oxidoreductase [Smithellaceae bacterium]HPI51000.1 FAD-dependent oxidoreductase [Smithellaceae bacterium]HPO22217.1 FAD-dependent oxidoreductase [Smithellaceae bacterium]